MSDPRDPARLASPDQTLRNQRDWLQFTLSCISDGVIAADREGRVNYLNPVAERLTGWALAEAVGKEVEQVFHVVNEQTREPAEQPIRKVLERGGTVGLGEQALLVARDGGERSCDGTAAATTDDRGTVLGVALVFRDTTERRHAARLVAAARAFAEGIVTTVREPLLVLDKDLHVVSANRSFYRTFDVKPGETVGRFVYDLGNGQWAIPRLRVLLEGIVPANGWFDDFEVEHDFEHIGPKTMLLNARRFPPEGPFELLLLAIEDITGRKQAEEKQRQSEALFVEAQQLAHIGSWNLDLVSGAFHWSDEHYRIFGFEPQDPPVTPDRAWDRVHPGDRARVQDLFEQAIRDRRPYECTFRLLLDDGSVRTVQSRGRPAVNQGGEAVRMFGTIQDLTAQARAEEALRESEARFRGTFDNAAVGIAHTDRTRHYIRVNQRFCDIVGHGPEELGAATCLGITHPDDTKLGVDQFDALMRGGLQNYSLEKRYLRKDGSTVWVNMSVSLQRDAAGDPAYAIEAIQDISDRKQAEEAVRVANERLELAIRGSNIGIWDLDLAPGGEYRHVPVRFINVWEPLGYDPAEFPATAPASRALGHRDDLVRVDAAVAACLAGETEEIRVENRILHKDGSYHWLLTLGTALRDASGRPVRLIGTVQDISERNRLEAELRQAKEAAEAANRAKDEFLANVSHEIRTPFGAILGMTELVLGTPLTDDQRQCLETARSAADSLLVVVDEVLDFAKIEAGKLELSPAAFSLRAAVGDAVRALAPRARKKGLALFWHVGPDVADAVVGDAVRLRQVLTNLVGNAIKFTERGQVAVRVEAAAPPAEGGVTLRFAVQDTGIGIAAAQQDRIFRAFEQEDASTTRRYGGTGLGLSIAARLVALMGGMITVDSEPGRGSTFAFTARFGRQAEPPGQAGPRPPAEAPGQPPGLAGPLRVLVAEDNEFNARHLERLLTWRGHGVRLASNGREALARAAEAPFDVLLLDLHMPELDGLQVVRAIRERERATGGHLPVIALTARARKEDREQCLAAGMDEFLAKPVRAADLFAAIGRVVSAEVAPRPGVPRAESDPDWLDPATLLAACDGDEEGLRGMCQDFRSLAPGRLAELAGALRDRDAPRVRESAHKFCGLLSAFSPAAGDVASNLEGQAAAGRLDEAQTAVAQLEAITQELMGRVGGLSVEGLRRRAATGSP